MSAKTVMLIETNLATRGGGFDSGAIRTIRQWWTQDGELVVEHDPLERELDAARYAKNLKAAERALLDDVLRAVKHPGIGYARGPELPDRGKTLALVTNTHNDAVTRGMALDAILAEFRRVPPPVQGVTRETIAAFARALVDRVVEAEAKSEASLRSYEVIRGELRQVKQELGRALLAVRQMKARQRAQARARRKGARR